MIVGSFLGVDAVGTYYFAFNAGSGITLGLVNAFSGAIFAHLCGGTRDREDLRGRYRQSIGLMAGLMVPAILLQALLAPCYVPIVFGTRWAEAVLILILICLSVVPTPFTTVTSQLARAASRPALDLVWQGAATTTLLLGRCVGIRFGIEGVAAAVLVTQFALGILFNTAVYRASSVRRSASELVVDPHGRQSRRDNDLKVSLTLRLLRSSRKRLRPSPYHLSSERLGAGLHAQGGPLPPPGAHRGQPGRRLLST